MRSSLLNRRMWSLLPAGTLAVAALCGLTFGSNSADAALIAYYPLSNSLVDLSGNGNNGTAGPDLTYGNGGITSSGSDSNQYFTSPVNINNLAQVTFGGWFDTTTTDNLIRGLIANDTGGYGRGLDIDSRVDVRLRSL